jgi:hypothetical protein
MACSPATCAPGLEGRADRRGFRLVGHYGQLGGEVDLVADFLAGAGVAPGDRVVVHVRKGVAEVAAIARRGQARRVVVT